MDSSPDENVSSPKISRITSTNNDKNERRQWSDLPQELLAKIAGDLGIFNLLSFRSVCTDWKLSSHTASAEIESSENHKPWFLLYGETSKCLLLTETKFRKTYTINVPELNGTTCLASNKGWLLILEKNSIIFFFCPLSHARIDLPNLPYSLNLSHNFGVSFSSPPTSKDCVVSIFCKKETSDHFELYFIGRGVKEWRNQKCENSIGKYLKKIKSATYCDKEFHFLDDTDGLVTFSVDNLKCANYKIVDLDEPHIEPLAFEMRRKYFDSNDMIKRLGLEGDDVNISICGTVVARKKKDEVIFSESISYNAAQGSEISRCLNGVWIHPRFFSVPEDHSW